MRHGAVEKLRVGLGAFDRCTQRRSTSPIDRGRLCFALLRCTHPNYRFRSNVTSPMDRGRLCEILLNYESLGAGETK
jgi:hypothetical protein